MRAKQNKCRYKLVRQDNITRIHPKLWNAYYEVLTEIKRLEVIHKKYNIANVSEATNTLKLYIQEIRKQAKIIQPPVYTISTNDHRLRNLGKRGYPMLSLQQHFYGYTDQKWDKKKKEFVKLNSGIDFITAIKKNKQYVQGLLHDHRRILRTPKQIDKAYQDPRENGAAYRYTLTGLVHTERGFFNNTAIAKTALDIFEYKGPKNKNNHVGLEIEFFCNWDRGELAANLVKEGLTKYSTIKSDGSIRPENNMFAHELCLLFDEREVDGVVKRAMGVLERAKAKVNKTCGFHVHIDMRNRNQEIVYSNLVSSQPILFAMNPKSRKEGTYSKVSTTKVLKDAGTDRYQGINPVALGRHQTLEVRIHAGTVNDVKILNWVKLLMTIANQTEVKPTTLKPRLFFKYYNLDADIAKYCYDRIVKFYDEKEPIEEAA
jgi:hypothetical protein